MDACKIGSNLYQYKAVDDCTRYRALQKCTADNTLDFLDKVIEETPFPVQRVQTDRGMEFFAEKVQRRRYYNWFRPHSSPGGKSPDERCLELSSITPFWNEVENNYHPEEERLQIQNYYDDLQLRKLNGCLCTSQLICELPFIKSYNAEFADQRWIVIPHRH